jgi:hypothetical protein
VTPAELREAPRPLFTAEPAPVLRKEDGERLQAMHYAVDGSNFRAIEAWLGDAILAMLPDCTFAIAGVLGEIVLLPGEFVVRPSWSDRFMVFPHHEFFDVFEHRVGD